MLKMCPTRAVVVDLPLVPVMAINRRLPGASAAALAAEQLDIADHLDGGFSRKPDHPMRRRVRERHAGRQDQRGNPRPVAIRADGGGNAGGIGLGHAPRIVVLADDVGAAGKSALALARPEPPSPNTATFLPAKIVTGITTKLPQLQGREPSQRQHDRDDPEANDDLRLGPAELLEVMVDRRHLEDALSGQLERHHLDDDGDRLRARTGRR